MADVPDVNQIGHSVVSVPIDNGSVHFYLPNPDDHIQRVIRHYQDFYERGMLEDVRRMLPRNALAVDVGANIGNHTVFFAAVCGARVVAIEPLATVCEILRKNVSLNGLSDQVQVIEKAAAAESGRGTIDPPPAGNLGQARLVRDNAGTIDVITVDSLALDHVALMKIDVEGMELDVLKGACRTLNEDRPVVYVEAQDASHYDEIRTYLGGLGYRAARVFNATPTHLFVPTGSEGERFEFLVQQIEFLDRSVGDLASATQSELRRLSQRQREVARSASVHQPETRDARDQQDRRRRELEQRLARAERQLAAMEKSTTYQVGQVLVESARHPASGVVALPTELWKLWRRRGRSGASREPGQRQETVPQESGRMNTRPTVTARPALARLARRPTIGGIMTPATVRRLGADVGVLSLAPADDLEAIERAPDIIVVEAKAFCSASAWFGGASSIAFDRMASALELLRHTRDAGIPSVLIENAPRQTLVNLSDLMEACDIVLSPGSDFPPALFPGVQLASFNPMNLGERGFTTPVFVWDGRASNEREVTELGKILKAVNERCSIDVVAEQAATIGAVMPARIMPEGASCHGVPGQALPVLYRSRAVALASNWASTSSPREMDVRALEQLACGARVVVPRSAYAPLEGLSEASAAEEVGMLVCDLAAASVRSRSDIQAGLRSLYGTMTSWDVARHVFQLCGLEDRLPSRRAVTLVAAVSSSDDVQRLVEGVRGQSIAPDRIHLAVGGDCVDNLAALAALSTPVSTVCVSEPERVDLGLLAADASTALVWIWSDLTSDPGSTLLADMLVARDCSGSDVVGRNGGWFTFTNGISPAHLLADRSLFDVPGTATVDVDGWARRGVRLFSIGPSRGGAA